MAAQRHFLREIGRPFFSYLATRKRAGIGAFFGSENIAERKKVVRRVKRDRHEKKGRAMKRTGGREGRVVKKKELDCAGIFEDILPRGKTDIALINNACLRPPG